MDTITTQDAAKLRGVHQQLILRWIHKGYIKAEAIGTGRRKIWMIDRESLLAYKSRGKGQPRKIQPKEITK